MMLFSRSQTFAVAFTLVSLSLAPRLTAQVEIKQENPDAISIAIDGKPLKAGDNYWKHFTAAPAQPDRTIYLSALETAEAEMAAAPSSAPQTISPRRAGSPA